MWHFGCLMSKSNGIQEMQAKIETHMKRFVSMWDN